MAVAAYPEETEWSEVQSAQFEILKKELRALCISAGKNIYLSLYELCRDYRDVNGADLGAIVNSLGYKNVTQFVWDLDEDVFNVFEDEDGQLRMKAVVTGETAHIVELISKQSNKKNKNKRAGRLVQTVARRGVPVRSRILRRSVGSLNVSHIQNLTSATNFSPKPMSKTRPNQLPDAFLPRSIGVSNTESNGSDLLLDSHVNQSSFDGNGFQDGSFNHDTTETDEQLIKVENANHPASFSQIQLYPVAVAPQSSAGIGRGRGRGRGRVMVNSPTRVLPDCPPFPQVFNSAPTVLPKRSNFTDLLMSFDSDEDDDLNDKDQFILPGKQLLAQSNPLNLVARETVPAATSTPASSSTTACQKVASAGVVEPLPSGDMEKDLTDLWTFLLERNPGGIPMESVSRLFFSLFRRPLSCGPSHFDIQEKMKTCRHLFRVEEKEDHKNSFVIPLPAAIAPQESSFPPPAPFRLVEHDILDFFDQQYNVKMFDSIVDPSKIPMDISHPLVSFQWQKPEVFRDRECGNFMPVNVTHVETPARFYIRMPKYKDQLNKLMDELDLLFASSQGDSYAVPNFECLLPNLPIALTYESAWHRALVLQQNHLQRTISVLYVDYGTKKANVTLEEVRFLPKAFLQLPFQAIKAALTEIKPIEADWTLKAQTEMLRMVSEVDLQAVNVMEQGSFEPMPNTIQPDGVLLVTLCDVRTDDDIYIHEQLVLRGLAVMEDELNSLIPDEFSSLSNSAINEQVNIRKVDSLLLMDEPVSRAVAEESRRSPPLDFGNTLQVKPSALSVVDQINSLTLSAPGLSSSLSKNSQIIGNNVAYNDAIYTPVNRALIDAGISENAANSVAFEDWDSDLENEFEDIVDNDMSHRDSALRDNGHCTVELLKLIEDIRMGNVSAKTDYSELRRRKAELVMYLVDEPPVDECEILMQQIGELNSKMKLYCAAKAKMALVGDYLELE